MRINKVLSLLAAASLSLAGSNALALYSVMEDAELVEKGKYLVTGETQFVTSGDSGLNLNGRFDGRLTESTGYRAELGFGATDFALAGHFKWAPIPDIDNQPAIALTSGIVYAREDDFNILTLRFAPIVSKKFQVEFGDLTPYGSIPINFASVSGEVNGVSQDSNDVPIQLVIGSQLENSEWGKFKVAAELGLDVNDAFSYFSLGFIIPLDPETGFELR